MSDTRNDNTNMNDPPKTATTTKTFPVSPMGNPKWLIKEEDILSEMRESSDKCTPQISVIPCDQDEVTEDPTMSAGNSNTNSSTATNNEINSEKKGSGPQEPPTSNMPVRSFSPTNGLETLILAATDSMRDDDTTSSLVSNEDHHSISSGSSAGRKLRTWQESFQALFDYKHTHGDTNVPVRYPPDSALANWVRYQQRNQDSLSREKKEQLMSIGFQFGARNDRQWDIKLQRLMEYQHEFGRHATIRDLELSQWVSTQRSLYKKNLLRADRETKLNDIGFVWQANQKHVDPMNLKNGRRETQWNSQFEKLKEFHKEHGHFRVPNQYEKDPSLGIWVSNQRSIHNRGQLPENRKALLDSIDFVWRVEAKDARASLYQKQWEQQLEGLLQYKLIHGHCDVPANFEKRGLGVWVVVQKEAGRKGSLDPLRAEKLLATGLAWGDERDTCWTKNFVKLQSFLVGKKIGCEVAFEEISSFDAKLANWIKLQCVVKKHNKLLLKRAFLLENIGCKWDETKMIVMSDASNQIVKAVVQQQEQEQKAKEQKAKEKKTKVKKAKDPAPIEASPSETDCPPLPDIAPSGPVATRLPTAIRPSVSSLVAPTLAVKRPSATRPRSPQATRPRSPPTPSRASLTRPHPHHPASHIIPNNIGIKRQVSATFRRGRDPPGDPPAKRTRTILHQKYVPEIVRSDPPGDAPSSSYIL